VCLVTLVLFQAPAAEAAVEADFNSDGVFDRITIFESPRFSELQIDLSGSDLVQTLVVTGQSLSIAAADLDQDGDTDLAAVSDRGLMVWQNVASGEMQPWRRAAAMQASHGCSGCFRRARFRHWSGHVQEDRVRRVWAAVLPPAASDRSTLRSDLRGFRRTAFMRSGSVRPGRAPPAR